jgi:hypothetical protein
MTKKQGRLKPTLPSHNIYSHGLVAVLGNPLNLDTSTALTLTVAETTTTVTESQDEYYRFVVGSRDG